MDYRLSATDYRIADDWDALFFMQHYGVPTRLLDWSENPFVGLYFAVMGAKFTRGKRGGLKFENHAAVWALDPAKWNRHALSHVGYNGDVLTAGDDDLKGYSPMRDLSTMNKQPVCMTDAPNGSCFDAAVDATDASNVSN